MSEKTAYQWFRKNILSPRDRIDRVENSLVLGMPDFNCCIEGNEFWVEIKAPTEPKRATTPLFGSNHKLSQDQKNWLLVQGKAKGKSFVLIETDKRRMLMGGAMGDFINEMTVEQLILTAVWHAPIPTKADDCERLRTILKRK